MVPSDVHLSGAADGTRTSLDSTIRSGSPIVHWFSPANLSGGGRSAGLPSGAPLSAQIAIASISASLRDGSFL